MLGLDDVDDTLAGSTRARRNLPAARRWRRSKANSCNATAWCATTRRRRAATAGGVRAGQARRRRAEFQFRRRPGLRLRAATASSDGARPLAAENLLRAPRASNWPSCSTKSPPTASAIASTCACVRSATPAAWPGRSRRWSSTSSAKAATGSATPGRRRGRWPATSRPASACCETLRPFVYRRYLDYGALDGLREMKAAISAEVARKELADDIKRGPGGIREIEFLVQALQLIRGGREPALRGRRLLPALQALVDGRPRRRTRPGTRWPTRIASCAGSRTACRCCAMRRRMRCPRSDADRARIAAALGYPDWDALRAALDEQRARVTAEFEALLAPRRRVADAPATLTRRTGARCPRRRRRDVLATPVLDDGDGPTAAAARFRARSPACARCRSQRARGWIACCRRCSKPPRSLREPDARAAPAAARCCTTSCGAAPVTWPCSTSSPPRWRAWSTWSRAARCWPNASRRIRCCWTNCWMRAWPARCPAATALIAACAPVDGRR